MSRLDFYINNLAGHSALFYAVFLIVVLLDSVLLNILILNLPLYLERQWIDAANEVRMQSVLKTRFHCSACQKPWALKQHVPVFSYLYFKGLCALCGQRTGPQYIIIEVLTLLGALCVLLYSSTLVFFIFAMLFISLCIALSFIDFNERLLPDSLTLSLLWLGLWANCASLFTSLPDAVLGASCAYLFSFFLANLYSLLRAKVGLGQGDFKLFAALGAWFGLFSLPYILFASSLMSVFAGILLLFLKKKPLDTQIPFGPFLCITGVFYLFFV